MFPNTEVEKFLITGIQTKNKLIQMIIPPEARSFAITLSLHIANLLPSSNGETASMSGLIM